MDFSKKLTEFNGTVVRIPDKEASDLSSDEQKEMTKKEIREHQTREATIEDHVYRLLEVYQPESMKEAFLVKSIGQKAAQGGEQELTEREEEFLYHLVEYAMIEKTESPTPIAMQIIDELDDNMVESKLDKGE